jgi:thioredoxin 1
MSSAKTLTDANFADEVRTSTKPFLVDFWASWCGPCRMMSPMVEQIAAAHANRLAVGKLNIDDNPQTADAYQVMTVPTMSVFVGGEVVKQIIGAKSKSALLRELSDFL